MNTDKNQTSKNADLKKKGGGGCPGTYQVKQHKQKNGKGKPGEQKDSPPPPVDAMTLTHLLFLTLLLMNGNCSNISHQKDPIGNPVQMALLPDALYRLFLLKGRPKHCGPQFPMHALNAKYQPVVGTDNVQFYYWFHLQFEGGIRPFLIGRRERKKKPAKVKGDPEPALIVPVIQPPDEDKGAPEPELIAPEASPPVSLLIQNPVSLNATQSVIEAPPANSILQPTITSESLEEIEEEEEEYGELCIYEVQHDVLSKPRFVQCSRSSLRRIARTYWYDKITTVYLTETQQSSSTCVSLSTRTKTDKVKIEVADKLVDHGLGAEARSRLTCKAQGSMFVQVGKQREEQRVFMHVVSPKYDEVISILDEALKEEYANGLTVSVFTINGHVDFLTTKHVLRLKEIVDNFEPLLKELDVAFNFVELKKTYTEVMYKTRKAVTSVPDPKFPDKTVIEIPGAESWADGEPDFIWLRDVYHYLAPALVKDIPGRKYTVYAAHNWCDIDGANMLALEVSRDGDTKVLMAQSAQGTLTQRVHISATKFDLNMPITFTPNANQPYTHPATCWQDSGPASCNDSGVRRANQLLCAEGKPYAHQHHLASTQYTSLIDHFGIMIVTCSSNIQGTEVVHQSIQPQSTVLVPFSFYVGKPRKMEMVAALIGAVLVAYVTLMQFDQYELQLWKDNHPKPEVDTYVPGYIFYDRFMAAECHNRTDQSQFPCANERDMQIMNLAREKEKRRPRTEEEIAVEEGFSFSTYAYLAIIIPAIGVIKSALCTLGVFICTYVLYHTKEVHTDEVYLPATLVPMLDSKANVQQAMFEYSRQQLCIEVVTKSSSTIIRRNFERALSLRKEEHTTPSFLYLHPEHVRRAIMSLIAIGTTSIDSGLSAELLFFSFVMSEAVMKLDYAVLVYLRLRAGESSLPSKYDFSRLSDWTMAKCPTLTGTQHLRGAPTYGQYYANVIALLQYVKLALLFLGFFSTFYACDWIDQKTENDLTYWIKLATILMCGMDQIGRVTKVWSYVTKYSNVRGQLYGDLTSEAKDTVDKNEEEQQTKLYWTDSQVAYKVIDSLNHRVYTSLLGEAAPCPNGE